MKEIKKIEIGKETVFLKKGLLGWKVVQPLTKDGRTLTFKEKDNINWFNLITGGWGNILFLIVIVILLLAFYFGINELISSYKEVARNPCKFCSNCFSSNGGIDNERFNYSIYVRAS